MKKVLLADDDVDDREIFEKILGLRKDVLLMPSMKNGIEVIDCLEKMTPGETLPHLIVLDHNMPKMNGEETLGLLKSSPKYSRILVVIYTTYTDERLTDNGLKLGASMVLSKPTTMKEYESIVEKFMGIIF